MKFQINDLSISWDESPRRALKACVRCKGMTKGRYANGGGLQRPAHMACAMSEVIEKASRFYTKEAANG